MVQSSKIYTCR